MICGESLSFGVGNQQHGFVDHFVEQLTKDIPFYRARHAVKPGLTGWAQVKYRYGASAEDALMKLQYDLFYIKHQGPYLDLLILLKTVQVVLGFKGR